MAIITRLNFIILLVLIFVPSPPPERMAATETYKITLTEPAAVYQDPKSWMKPSGTISPMDVFIEQEIPGWYRIQTEDGGAWIKKARSMRNKLKNIALGKPYVINTPYLLDEHFKQIASRYSQNMQSALTDGKYGGNDYRNVAFIGMFSLTSRTVVVDLQQASEIREISLCVLHDSIAGIYVPRKVRLSVSHDRQHWQELGPVASPLPPTAKQTVSLRMISKQIDTQARYVKLTVEMTGNSLFIDEIEVWGFPNVPGQKNSGNHRQAADPPLPPAIGNPAVATPQYAEEHDFPASRWFKNQVLIYTGFTNGKASDTLTFSKEDFKPYVTYVDRGQKRKDWMFDSYLFLPYAQLWDGANFHAGRGSPTKKYHWEYFLTRLFREGYELPALEQAVQEAKTELRDARYQAKVVIAIPFPPTDQPDFGDLDGDGRTENLDVVQTGEQAALENRKKVVKWFVDQVEQRWREQRFQHLKLIGFYWYNEFLAEHESLLDANLIRWTADYLHQKGYMFEWIPYFFSHGWNDWRELGFDVAILQPNYMFHPAAGENRMDITGQAARDYGLGIEIELRDAALHERRWRERYFAYLNKNKESGYMYRSYQVFYQEWKALLRSSRAADPAVREIYDQTYLYLTGKY